jgi:hypothetical protein
MKSRAQQRFERPRAPDAARVEFIDENGGGPGVRLRERQQKKKP